MKIEIRRDRFDRYLIITTSSDRRFEMTLLDLLLTVVLTPVFIILYGLLVWLVAGIFAGIGLPRVFGLVCVGLVSLLAVGVISYVGREDSDE